MVSNVTGTAKLIFSISFSIALGWPWMSHRLWPTFFAGSRLHDSHHTQSDKHYHQFLNIDSNIDKQEDLLSNLVSALETLRSKQARQTRRAAKTNPTKTTAPSASLVPSLA